MKIIKFKLDEVGKLKYRKQLQDHYDADEIVQGKYWTGGKGCAVGCLIHGENHEDFETLFGIPEQVARLLDFTFENLTNKEAKEFPLQFWTAIEKIETGADMKYVWPKLAIWLLSDTEYGVLKYVRVVRFEEQRKSIERVVRLYTRFLGGDEPAQWEWDDAESAAMDVAMDAAYAARNAAMDAECAAYAVARDVGDKFAIALRDKLIGVLGEVK